MMCFAAGALAAGGTLAGTEFYAQPGALPVGRFYSGTPADVLGSAGGWTQVSVGAGMGVIGGYVPDGAVVAGAQDKTMQCRVASPYGTQSVVLRDVPSNSYRAVAMLAVGESVRVIGEAGEFRFVITGSGCAGCLLASELK